MMHPGKKASLTLWSTAEQFRDTLYLDNGGSSGMGYLIDLSPCSSKGHSTPRYVQVLTNFLFSGTPVRCLLVLFTAFQYVIGMIIARQKDLSRFFKVKIEKQNEV
jgi:hypothetical protein